MFLFSEGLGWSLILMVCILIAWIWLTENVNKSKTRSSESYTKNLQDKLKEHQELLKQKEKDLLQTINVTKLEYENKLKDLRNTSNELRNKEIDDIKRKTNELIIKHHHESAGKQLEFEKSKSELRQQLELAYQEKLKVSQERLNLEFQKFKLNEVKLQAEILLKNWISENELRIRQDAIKRSGSVNMGKITEHLLPFHTNFPFNHKDVRFIGSPIDLLVFDGHNEGNEEITVYFIEVKTGNSKLSNKQQNIKKAIEEKRIKWEVLTPEGLELVEPFELPFPKENEPYVFHRTDFAKGTNK